MQKGSTFAVAWAVVACASTLPHAARADSGLTPVPAPTTSSTVPLDANQLGLVDGRHYVFDLSKQIPLPGQQKVGIDLMSIGRNMGDVWLKAETSNLLKVGGISFSATAAGTVHTMTGGKDDLSNLNVGLRAETMVWGSMATLNLNTTVGALEEGNLEAIGFSMNWTKPLEGGSSLNFTGGGNLGGEGRFRLGATINLHPDAPAAPPPLDMDWKSQWEPTGPHSSTHNVWGTDRWSE